MPAGTESDTDASSGGSGSTTGTTGEADSTVDPDSGSDSSGGSTGLPEPTTQPRDTGATLYTWDLGEIRIHAYSNDDAHVNTGNYLIEGPTAVVAVDISFQADVAADLWAFVDSLGKPLERIIFTHEHPDHWFGYSYDVFEGVEGYASEGVVDAINGPQGDQFFAFFSSGARELFGEPPAAKRAPQNVLPEQDEVIDGIGFEYTVFEDLEAEEQVVIRLPDYDVLLTGDLVYHDVHPVLAPVPAIEAWSDVLEDLSNSLTDRSLVLPGHGGPGERDALQELRAYMDTALSTYEAVPGPQSWSYTMMQEYPQLANGPFLVPLSASLLYGGTPIPASVDLTDEPWPESLAYYDQRVYASNWATGGLAYVDLREPGAGTQLFAAAAEGYSAYWGLSADPSTNTIWVLANENAGPTFIPGDAALLGYDAITAELREQIELPNGTIANDLTLGPDGSIYITDVSPAARILRVSADGEVTPEWLDDDMAWPAAFGFGLGGIVWNFDALYVGAEGAIWRVEVGDGGSAVGPVLVELDAACDQDPGAPGVQLGFDGLDADGFGNLVGAANDVAVPGANGSIIVVSVAESPATCTTVQSGLKDPSDVWVSNNGFSAFAIATQSQFGHIVDLGGGPVDPGEPDDPWVFPFIPL